MRFGRTVVMIVVLVLLLSLSACGDGVEAAPDFSLENAVGEDVSLSEYRGTPVLLFFHMADG